ncbi:MAG TPA: hypothetical protein VES93_10980, partial [Ornithinibacter sp.]|nr:hypothetical protein [Ornithinibacter sp.]
RPGTPPTAPALTETPTSATTWSALETHLQLRLEHHPHPDRDQHLWLPPTHRRCTSATDLRAGLARSRPNAPIPDLPPF